MCIAQYVLAFLYVRRCGRCFRLIQQSPAWSSQCLGYTSLCTGLHAMQKLCCSYSHVHQHCTLQNSTSQLSNYVIHLYDDLVLQRKSEEPVSVGPPVGSSEDWVVLNSGKSFAWSAKQHGSLQQQIDAMEKLIQQQGQQVQHILEPMPPLTTATSELI